MHFQLLLLKKVVLFQNVLSWFFKADVVLEVKSFSPYCSHCFMIRPNQKQFLFPGTRRLFILEAKKNVYAGEKNFFLGNKKNSERNLWSF